MSGASSLRIGLRVAFAGLDRAVGVTFFPVFEEIFVEVAAFEVAGDEAGTWYERCFRDGFFAIGGANSQA